MFAWGGRLDFDYWNTENISNINKVIKMTWWSSGFIGLKQDGTLCYTGYIGTHIHSSYNMLNAQKKI